MGETHYGWARLSVQVQLPLTITATLTGYAYETIPNTSINAGQVGPNDTNIESNSIEPPHASLTARAPQPATLGILALGAPVLSVWRRERSVDAAK